MTNRSARAAAGMAVLLLAGPVWGQGLGGRASTPPDSPLTIARLR